MSQCHTLFLLLTPSFAQYLAQCFALIWFLSPSHRALFLPQTFSHLHQSGPSSFFNWTGFCLGLLGSHPPSQLVFFPFVCLDCFSGREALRAFTQLAYLLSLSHCHIVILCYINIYTSPVSTVVDLALKLRHTANAQRSIFSS